MGKMKLVEKPPPAKALAHFDLSDEDVAQIISDAHAERMRLDEFSPKNAAGLTFYFWFIAALRRFLITTQKGWKSRSICGLEFVEHAKKKIRIGYVSADAGTGSPD